MKFTAIIVAALSTSAFAVVQDCGRAGLDPYCCESVNNSPFGSFSVGFQCTKQKRGKKTRCPTANQQKQCCEQKASTFGPVTICQNPFFKE